MSRIARNRNNEAELEMVNQALRLADADNHARYVGVTPSGSHTPAYYTHRGPGDFDPAQVLRKGRVYTAEMPVPALGLGEIIISAMVPNPVEQLRDVDERVRRLSMELRELQRRASRLEAASAEPLAADRKEAVADVVSAAVNEVCGKVRSFTSLWRRGDTGDVLSLKLSMATTATPEDEVDALECAHRAFVQATSPEDRESAELLVEFARGS